MKKLTCIYTTGLTLILGLAISTASAVTIYVDAATSTPPGDGSSSDPFETIMEGVNNLAASNTVSLGGHTLSIASGTYNEAVTFTSSHSGGTSQNKMLATGGSVIIDSNGLVLNQCTNIVIDGITVDQAPAEGIKLLTGTSGVNADVTITNCTVRHSVKQGIYIARYNSNVNISETFIYDNRYSGVYSFGYSDGIFINHCLILANGNNGILQSIQSYITTKNSIIVGNGGYGAGEEHNQGDITPINCCFYGNGRGEFFSVEYIYFPDPGEWRVVQGVYNTAEGINNISGGSGNLVGNPGFSDLANNWNFSQLYSDSIIFDAADDGDDIGPYQSTSTVTPANNTYYVNDATGSDANSTIQAQNSSTPWKSITHAATIAAAGDTVIVAEGTYTGQAHITKGGSVNPVTYQGNGTVILDGQSTTDKGFYLDFASGIILEGFEVKSYTDSGIALNYCMSNSISNIKTHHNAVSGINLRRSQRTAFTDMTICSNSTHGIFFETEAYYRSGSGGTTLNRCSIFGHTGWVNYGILKLTGFSPEKISNCNIYNNWRGINCYNGTDFTIENCVLSGNNIDAQYSYAVAISLTAIKCTVINCIIANNTIGLKEEHPQGDFNSINNCYYNNSVADYYDADGGGNLTNVTDINNLSDVTSTNNIGVDPLFINVAEGNFRLDKESLCINAGTTYTDLKWDLYGNPRFIGKAVDIGSFEYNSHIPGTVIIIN